MCKKDAQQSEPLSADSNGQPEQPEGPDGRMFLGKDISAKEFFEKVSEHLRSAGMREVLVRPPTDEGRYALYVIRRVIDTKYDENESPLQILLRGFSEELASAREKQEEAANRDDAAVPVRVVGLSDEIH